MTELRVEKVECRNRNGFVAISTVLIVSAVTLAVMLTVSFLSIGEGQASLAGYLGESDLALVEGCAEDALQKFHDNGSYAGGSFTRPEGAGTSTCNITLNSGSPNYDITVTATSGDSAVVNYNRKIQVKFT